MKSNFLKLVVDSFLKTYGLPATVISLGIVFFALDSAELIIQILVAALIIFVLATITFWHAAFTAYQAGKKALPKLLGVKSVTIGEDHESIIYLLEPSELFSHGIVVSVYVESEGFELLLGLGQVTNIQEDGKIQVVFLETQQGNDELIRKLQQNDAQVINRTKIKPNVPRNIYSGMQGEI